MTTQALRALIEFLHILLTKPCASAPVKPRAVSGGMLGSRAEDGEGLCGGALCWLILYGSREAKLIGSASTRLQKTSEIAAKCSHPPRHSLECPVFEMA